MRLTTRKLLFRAANTLRINRYFHRLTPLEITAKKNDLISPVEAKLQAVVPYSHDQICMIKNKPINLTQQLGDDAQKFENGTVCSLYLAPHNKHFRILPVDGRVEAIHAHEGSAKYLQTLLGAEKIIRHLPYLRHRNLLQKALTRNATHTTILKTAHGHLALIAIGSLGVNHIHCTFKRWKKYQQWAIAGRFAIGSSFLLVASKGYIITAKPWKTTLWQILWTSK